MKEGVISQAKREVNLVDFLERELGVKPRSTSKGFRFSSCPHCGPGPSGSMKLSVLADSDSYHCFGCMGKNDSRSVVDAAAALFCLDPTKSAVKLLKDNGYALQPASKFRPVFIKQPEENVDHYVSEVILKLFDCLQGRKNDKVMNYLTVQRGIQPWVIQACIDQKMLGFMPEISYHAIGMLNKHIGKDLMVKAKMWNPEKNAPAVAFRPLVSFFPGRTRAEFRLIKPASEGEAKGMRYGTDTFPWYFEQDSTNTAIVEGFIDMMSLLSLGWEGSVIALAGTNSWKTDWFVGNAKKRGVSRFFSFLDNDNETERTGPIKNPGVYWTYMLDAALKKEGLEHVPCQPDSGDLNDVLRSGASLSDLMSNAGVLHKPSWLVELLARDNKIQLAA